MNLGDTYAGGGRGGGGSFEKICQSFRRDRELIPRSDYQVPGVPTKSLCCIPDRFRIEMINRGWILRNKIIWYKPNPMPSSARDRFTVDFEDVMFFTKAQRYWFEPQYEEYAPASDVRYRQALRAGKSYNTKEPYRENTPYCGTYKRGQGAIQSRGDDADGLCVGGVNPLGRNKRTVWTIPNDGFYIEDEKIVTEVTKWLKIHYPQQSAVWTIPTQAYAEAHFATFPEKLVEPMIKAGCPEFVCTKCGKAREKIYEPSGETARDKLNIKGNSAYSQAQPTNQQGLDYAGGHNNNIRPKTFKGYTDCGCGEKFRAGVMIDPFVGRALPVWLLPKTAETGLGLN